MKLTSGRGARRYLRVAVAVVFIAMHNRLLVAALIAATPILALSPAAFPETDDQGCVRATAGVRRNQRELMSLMRRRDGEAEQALAAYAVPHVRSREVKQVTDPELC